MDAAGNVNNSSVNVVFDNDLTAPTSSITSPTSGAVLNGIILIEATASDDRGTVSKVEFYRAHPAGLRHHRPLLLRLEHHQPRQRHLQPHQPRLDPSGNSVYSSAVPVTILQPGTAEYDATLGVPRYSAVAYRCDSTTLLKGRANLGPEPHQPNTLGGSCRTARAAPAAPVPRSSRS